MSADAVPAPAAAAGITVSRRLLARSIDLLWQLPFGVVAWYGLQHLTDLHWALPLAAAAIGTCAVQVTAESLLVWTSAGTPGKLMLGMGVYTPEGSSLSFRQSLLRAVMVVAWGFACWLLPLTMLASLWWWKRLRSGAALPWERGEGGNAVQAHRARMRQLAPSWAIALCVPFIASISLGLFLAEAGAFQASTTLSQSVRRGLSGHWLWLHPFSGKTLSLDTRWRLRLEDLRPRDGEYAAMFAFGDGTSNLVKLTVHWSDKLGKWTCYEADMSLRQSGFTVTHVHEKDQPDRGDCFAQGGRVDGSGIVYGFGRESLFRKSRVRYAIQYSYADESGSAREEVTALVERLTADFGNIDMASDGLRRYFWRNELTGLVVPIPGTWELDHVTLRTGPMVEQAFVRWSGKTVGDIDTKDAAIIMGARPNVMAEAVKALSTQLAGFKPVSNPGLLQAGEPKAMQHFDFESQGQTGRITLFEGKRFAWLVVWANNESKRPAEPFDEHELVRQILPTLD